MDGWMEWMDGWMDGWMDRWMDGWMDECSIHMHSHAFTCIHMQSISHSPVTTHHTTHHKRTHIHTSSRTHTHTHTHTSLTHTHHTSHITYKHHNPITHHVAHTHTHTPHTHTSHITIQSHSTWRTPFGCRGSRWLPSPCCPRPRWPTHPSRRGTGLGDEPTPLATSRPQC